MGLRRVGSGSCFWRLLCSDAASRSPRPTALRVLFRCPVRNRPNQGRGAWIAFGLPGMGDAGLLRTLDGGRTWSQLAGPGGDVINGLEIAASAPHDLYAMGQKLYRSSDQGASWQLLSEAPPNSDNFQLDPHRGAAAYVLDASGLLYEMVE